MDAKKTGSFISALRREKGMTQKQLADKLNVSDKAVSRWETGRGLPDIGMLMALSCEFSVSINELLCGTRIISPVMAAEAARDIAGGYIEVSKKKKRFSVIIIVLAALLSLFATAFLTILLRQLPFMYNAVMGSPSCVITEDYSSFTLMGDKYVPLILPERVECSISEKLIKEAQVENTPFIGKLLFGESIYSVKMCPENEIVYLQSDYGFLESDIYCLESRLEHYREMLENISLDSMIAVIETKDCNLYDLKLCDEVRTMLEKEDYTLTEDVSCYWLRGDGDEGINVYSTQTDGPFRYAEGELIRKKGQYYWYDYDDVADLWYSNPADITAYSIDDSYDSYLDELFSYMLK